MAHSSDRLVWIDCEMTGLNVEVDEIVEIAVVVTDFELTPLDEGLSLVIAPSERALRQMNDFVRGMHETSGLLADLPGGLPLEVAQTRVIEYIDRFVPGDKRPPLAGNTIGTDRMFIARHMPALDARLHYRSVDVSSIKELSRRWFPHTYGGAPVKTGGHRALADILESVRELDYYRRTVFVAPPGPAAEEAAEAARASVTAYTTGTPEEAGGAEEPGGPTTTGAAVDPPVSSPPRHV